MKKTESLIFIAPVLAMILVSSMLWYVIPEEEKINDLKRKNEMLIKIDDKTKQKIAELESKLDSVVIFMDRSKKTEGLMIGN